MDDMNKSYQQIGNEILAQGGGKITSPDAMGGGGPADPTGIFKQFEMQAAEETGNPPGSDGALIRATQMVFENVIAPMPDEELMNMTASDAAAFMFGNPEAAGEFGPEFDQMDAAGKRQVLTDIAGSGDPNMQKVQASEAEQMMTR